MLKLFKSLVFIVFLLVVGCAESPVKTACETNDDCFNDDNYIQYVCDVAISQTCMRSCTPVTDTDTDSADCLESQYCDVPEGASEGICRQDTDLSADDG